MTASGAFKGKDDDLSEVEFCPDCKTEMLPFTYSRDGYDVEYGLGCPNCGRRDY